MTTPAPTPTPAPGQSAARALVVACADWPVAAAGMGPDDPAFVLHANRVVAATPAARDQGVQVGLRRRDAQSRCPSAVVLARDPSRDARVFEPLVAALEALTPRIEILEPGRCVFATRGPSRYFGGDLALARRAATLMHQALAEHQLATEVSVGVADGVFAAGLAARAAQGEPERVRVVAAGQSAAFLAPWLVSELAPVLPDGPALVDVWQRLGLRTLGTLATLDPADVLARFGRPGAEGHRLAAGLDPRPAAGRAPSPEFAVSAGFDPPAEEVAPVAFMARTLAEALHERLDTQGLACTRIIIGAETEHGEHLERVWRHEGALTAGAIADRARWQLDGWLTGPARHRPTAGITRLVLTPDEVAPAHGRQLGFWGGESRVDERAVRALARVQGLLGLDAVTVPEHRGGRGPIEQIAAVPVAQVDLTAPRPAARAGAVAQPWPGRVPTPSPATVHVPPIPAEVVDPAGSAVGVSGRGVLTTGAPARLRWNGRWADVASWAGPWPVEERWWDPVQRRRRARFQLVTAAGDALLLSLESGQWWIEATYD